MVLLSGVDPFGKVRFLYAVMKSQFVSLIFKRCLKLAALVHEKMFAFLHWSTDPWQNACLVEATEPMKECGRFLVGASFCATPGFVLYFWVSMARDNHGRAGHLGSVILVGLVPEMHGERFLDAHRLEMEGIGYSGFVKALLLLLLLFLL